MVIWTLIVFTTPGSLIKPQETPPGIFSFLEQVIMLWLSGVRDMQGDWIALPWLAVVILPVVVIGAWLANRRSTRWVVAFAAVSLSVAYAMTLVLTSFHPRYALPYSVPLFVMLGAALSNLSQPRRPKHARSCAWADRNCHRAIVAGDHRVRLGGRHCASLSQRQCARCGRLSETECGG